MDPRNPFASPSPLPFAFPPFDRIRLEHVRPAFEAGVDEHRAEVAAVAGSEEPPTFANTVEALERSGQLLKRVLLVFWNLAGSMATEEMQDLEAVLAPLVAEHDDAVRLDPALFARLDAVHRQRAQVGLTGEQRRLVERYHADFLRAGAGLSPGDKDRLRRLNEEITELTTEFGRRALAERNERAVLVTDRSRLAGLSDDAAEAAAAAARSRGVDGWLLTLVSPTPQPALAVLADRELRRELHDASVGRGMSGGPHDTRALVGRLAALRARRAALLGHPDHASYVVADQTAGSTSAVRAMLISMVGPAMRNLEAERQALEASMRADGVPGPLEPWDWSYYAARVRADRFDVDPEALRPWLSLERVLRQGVFAAAERLYGLGFAERSDLPVYAEGVRVFDVADADGTPLGLFVFDPFARPTKQGGAWMSELVEQSRLLGTRPVAVVCLNVPRPPEGGAPALLATDEVRTAFHEFGHALHGLLSDVGYPRIAGTAVPRDFVEFPSQVNEMWAWWPDLLAGYAVHHETGEPLEQEAVDRLVAAEASGQGYDTVSMLGAALLDQAWHQRDPDAPRVPPEEVDAFEEHALAEAGVASRLVPPRYRSGYFAHVFSGGYDAGYYSYLWSEVLDADLVDWFAERGGPTRENGDLFRGVLLSRGGAVDPMTAFAAVRGRPPSPEPLLRRRGLLDR